MVDKINGYWEMQNEKSKHAMRVCYGSAFLSVLIALFS